MYALIFTNTILGSYLAYIIAEKRKNSLKSHSFWMVLLLLLFSFTITSYMVVKTGGLDAMVRESVLLP